MKPIENNPPSVCFLLERIYNIDYWINNPSWFKICVEIKSRSKWHGRVTACRNLSGKLMETNLQIKEEDLSLRATREDVLTLSAVMEKVDKGQDAINKAHDLMCVFKSPSSWSFSDSREEMFTEMTWNWKKGTQNRPLAPPGRVSNTNSNN